MTSDAILCTDRAGVIRFWNRAAEQVFGYAAAEVLGRDLDCIIPPAMVDAHHRGFERVRGGAESALAGRSIALPARRKDGTEFPIELSIARWGEPEGIGGFAAIVRDISARRELERERQQASDFLDTIVANLPAMLFVKDAESRRYLLVNAAGERLTGRSAAEMIGETDAALFPESGPAAEARDEEALRAALPRTDESCFVRADGGRVHIRTRRIVIDGPERPRQFILGLSEDISEARRAEAEVHRLAHFDTLTGLINRDSFLAELERRVADAIPFAFLSIDLDRFKAVNEQFGHATGDEVLVILGERLRAAVRADDIAARTGGDEFAVLLLGPDAEARARSVAQRLVERFAEPIATSRAIAHSGATIGIALAPQDGATPNAVRQSVELARERAKADGRGQFRFFSPEQDASARARRALEADLRLAIERGEIALAYQPIVATATGQITSVEALARWSHPVHGPIPPDLFVSLAEESGLIHALGALVLRRACADATNFAVDVRVAVNLSPLQFQGGALCEQVRAILAETGLDPHRLQLEVTEGLVIRDVEATFHELNRLRAQGIHIHLDDFGVGYSSLGYFQRFRFDTVKIDKSFVDTIATSASARAIIGAVVGLGGALGMKVVAEGVEEAAQMELLVALGCTHLQGYLFSRPVSAEAVRALLAQPAAPLRAAL
ncbi:EAL domain-containing protein [Sphingomonas morindae]|uniref:EAL domain-containing protein n=1 Tax=Sphingomonas morindae TaxID=1541170 RepID=A0ABY4XCR6_9SPHN|nr:EAL domain-containing protein [Sphingomonas morindae]